MYWLAIGSTLIAAVALFFNGYNLFLSRRNREIEAVFELWERYERYSDTLAAARRGDKTDQARSLLNLLNFLENICFLYNKAHVTRRVRVNIRALATDIVALVQMSSGRSFEQVLVSYQLGAESFSELRTFLREHEIVVLQKEARARGTIYDEVAKLAQGSKDGPS